MRVDDDVYIHPERLSKFLASLNHTKALYLGETQCLKFRLPVIIIIENIITYIISAVYGNLQQPEGFNTKSAVYGKSACWAKAFMFYNQTAGLCHTPSAKSASEIIFMQGTHCRRKLGCITHRYIALFIRGIFIQFLDYSEHFQSRTSYTNYL